MGDSFVVVVSIRSDQLWKVEQILKRLCFHRNWSSQIYSLNSALQTCLVAESCVDFLSSLNVSGTRISGPEDPDGSPSARDISWSVPDLPDIPLFDHASPPSESGV